MTGRALFVAALATLAIGVAACGIQTHVGAGGLRTYDVDPDILCNLSGDMNPPTGTLAGSPDDPERVWLVGPDGERISVVWPQGFSVEFTPAAVLSNETGVIVARAGDTVVLDHAADYPGNGSAASPYLATRAFGCYEARR